MSQMHNYKLGKREAIHRDGMPRIDDHKLMLRRALDKLAYPDDCGAQMDDNNELGICTAAGLANAGRAAAKIAGWTLNIPTTSTVAFYSQSTGYDPNKPGSDQGGIELDVLANAARVGFQYGGQAPLVPLWGTIDHGDLNGIRLCAAELRTPVYLGLQLALADQTSVGAVFDTTTPGDQTPGSWGGHCGDLYDYEGIEPDSIVRLITWGGLQKATWRWLQSRMDEAHALSFRQLRAANVLGVDFNQWQADCAAYLGYA